MRRNVRYALLGALLLPALVAAQSVAPPPQPLHMVGDHWTPYDPPTEFPEGAKVHVIERGDTLWDLAAKNLGDPYLWPQIWERNPYIKDAHWIYPGDPLVIDIAVEAPPAPPEEQVTPEEPEVTPAPTPGPTGPEGEPVALGNSADVYCFAQLRQDESAFPFSIAGGEEAEYQDDYATGDVVYINGGTAEGVAAGDRFFILARGRILKHPVSGVDMGRIYLQNGQLKVLCAQEHTSIAEITTACDPISVGNLLQPYEATPVPLVFMPEPVTRCDAPNGMPTGTIVYNKDDDLDVGEHTMVMVDLGSADGLYPGQFATVFRDNPVKGMPRLVMGEVGIMTVEEHHATAKITRGWAPIRVGDRVEMRP